MSMSGSACAQRGEEPLHQQAVAQRVDPGDAEQVVDQAAGARPAGRAPHAHVADQVGDVGDGEEVGGVAELADDLAARRRAASRSAAAARCRSGRPIARLAARPQHRVGGRRPAPRAGAVRSTAELGEVHLAEAEVGARVERAPVGRPPGCGPAGRGRRRLAAARRSRQISSATSAISLPDLRNPSALPRSTWRRSSGTSRRAASRTSTVGASARSA